MTHPLTGWPRRALLLALAGKVCTPLWAQTTTAGAAPAAGVVASFSILADMARELAPAGTEVLALVGPDSDAHVFEPRPADARRLAQADLVLVNGLGFEGWLDRLVKVSGFKGRLVVASQGVVARVASPAHHGHGHRHAHGAVDPHAWQDLAHAHRYIGNLSAAFAQRWPTKVAEINSRRHDYLARVDALDRRVRDWLGAIPRAQRRVITSHDAFGYFGAAYGIDFLAPQGWATNSEASAAAVGKLIRQIRQQNVKALFVENISDPRLLQRIAQEGGARIGGTLYSDALSNASGPAATYLKMVEHNARTLSEALSG
ncbi:MAG: zinc ABC transporter substrate-binding protein [Rubrivivax sp.]|nr:zinc ABC transporter substrate-binding protein [Rubrivivax sp.]